MNDVKLGDEVKMFKGLFAGETGTIVGIMACGNDYTDPYYEVDMNCEVPDKYKCRKTLITPNNVIGGVSANEFEVMVKEPSDNKPTGGVKAVLSDAYWEEYRAELVKELVFKLINANDVRCLQNANYITDFATRIVDNLKKQSK